MKVSERESEMCVSERGKKKRDLMMMNINGWGNVSEMCNRKNARM